ncbi:MAG TPA: hypothetical protein VFO65_14460, partial [Acidimicrobiales bacterium]|nr:hypothetical protein [Acidimicrobiales bacterium]
MHRFLDRPHHPAPPRRRRRRVEPGGWGLGRQRVVPGGGRQEAVDGGDDARDASGRCRTASGGPLPQALDPPADEGGQAPEL